jgi:ABC-2 type transport system ATP-binding protein
VTTLVSTHYMDEAVQCDSIAYIAYGKKLLDAPTGEIPKQIGLHAWRVAGRPLLKAQQMLEAASGVELVARFGAELHACGKDATLLEAAVRAAKQAEPHLEIEPIEAGFEEIFIYLMSGSIDNCR